jgi:hypothetical protein
MSLTGRSKQDEYIRVLIMKKGKKERKKVRENDTHRQKTV